jgi:hypothetical protein
MALVFNVSMVAVGIIAIMAIMPARAQQP